MKNCKRCNKEILRNNYCGKCYTLNFRERNPGRMEELCAQYYENNKDHVIKRVKKYNKDNVERQAKNHARWIKNTNYDMNRYNSDVNYKLIKIQRARIRNALKGLNKSQTTQELIGCTIEELKAHLESQFESWMTWENYGKYGWHVDHIIPISKFDLTDEQQLKEACNYKNLKPMHWRANIVKRDKDEI
jgi:hypothetical protein